VPLPPRVTDDGRHVDGTNVPRLTTYATQDIMEQTTLYVYLRSQSRLRIDACDRARHVAQVADMIVLALPSYVHWLTTVVACMFIGAANDDVA
jgi:hypothetical protein